MANIELKDITEKRIEGSPQPANDTIIGAQTAPAESDPNDRPYESWSWGAIVEWVTALFTFQNLTGNVADNEEIVAYVSDPTNITQDATHRFATDTEKATWNAKYGQEEVEDTIGTKVIAGTNVTVSYNDATGETTINASGGGGGVTDISIGADDVNNVVVQSSTGTDGTITPASTVKAGTYSVDKFIETRKPQKIGELLGGPFTTFSSLTNYVNNAGATVSGGVIQLSGGTDNVANRLEYNYYTGLARWHQEARIKILTKSATSNGIGIGVRGTLASNYVRFDSSTNANSGKLIVVMGSTTVATSSLALTFSANDVILLTIERELDIITAKVRNVTTSSAEITVSYKANMAVNTERLHNTGRWTFFNFSGSFEVQAWRVYSGEIKYADLMVIGDSKTVGYNASLFIDSFPSRLSFDFSSVVIHAGGGDQMAVEGTLRLPEIVALAPKQVLICGLGRNDIDSGSSVVTTMASYNSFVSTLVAAKIAVYHTNQMYEPVLNLAPLSTALDAAYGPSGTIAANTLIDVYTDTSTIPNIMAADNVHLNTLGNTVVYNRIISNNFLKYQSRLGADLVAKTTPVFTLIGTVITPSTGTADLSIGTTVNGSTGVSVATPVKIFLGDDFCNTANQPLKAKIIACNLGTSNYSWGVSATAGSEFFGALNTFRGAVVFAGGNITVSTRNIITDTATGTRIATAVNQKLGFWNVTPVVQPASANQAAITDSTTGTPSFTLAQSTAVYDSAIVNNNFASINRQLDAFRTALVATGLIKGAA
jgi:hypothetical protein